MKEVDVQRVVLRHLKRSGWSEVKEDNRGRSHGVDIKVTHARYSRDFLVEVKGDCPRDDCCAPEKSIPRRDRRLRRRADHGFGFLQLCRSAHGGIDLDRQLFSSGLDDHVLPDVARPRHDDHLRPEA